MSTVQLQLLFYSKLSNTQYDSEVFAAITGYEVASWVDKDPVQIIDLVRKPGEKELQMLDNLINHLTLSTQFRGWFAFPDFATQPLYYTPCIEVPLIAVEFCSMISPFELNSHYTAMTDESVKVVAMFEHDIRRILIYICDEAGKWNRIYIHYDELESRVVQQMTEEGTIRLVLCLKNCPSFWESNPEMVANKKKRLKNDQYSGARLEKKLRSETVWNRIRTLTPDEGTFDIPKCSAIVLTYNINPSTVSRLVSGFKKHQFQCFFTKFDELRFSGCEGDDTSNDDWIDEVMSANSEHTDNINLLYSLRCLESIGYQFLDKLYKTSPNHKISFLRFLIEKVQENHSSRIELVTQTIYKLVFAFSKDPYLDPVSVFQSLFDRAEVRICSIESHYQYIKRIIVTPSRTIFVPPEPIAINRILRQHICYLDNFARVCFRDEDFSQFNVHSEEGTQNVRRVIEDGIRISDDIVFQFLGCSNSQLRSQGLWLFYPQCPVNIESIRDSVGDLNKMKTTQKYVTRMGLAFTATDFSLSQEVEIEEIDEVERIVGNKRFIFSDGVGRISPLVRDMIIKEKYGDNYRDQNRPVAFQVRVGGCKGMVAVDPSLGDRPVLQIRPSMKKFESQHKQIEPCGYSGPRELYMNRQVIAILRAQGVPDNNFITLQNRSLLELADMLTSEKLAAYEMGSKLRVRTSDLEKNCVRITTEPFLRRQLVSLYKFKIRDAIAKTRFRIDHDKGRQMKGIMDETHTLNYGEIFVQYTDLANYSHANNKIILEGDVFITKNPCLHPGDLKKVKAVDVPALHHLYDVIVFPAKGQRDHPNELSGSDLDGDEYFVCWEKSLMPQKSFEPADFYIELIEPSNEASAEPPAPITEREINDFVFNYITKGSKLGQISNAHAIWADRKEHGVASDMCLKLANKHSEAVDFIKTGIAPEFHYAERSLIYPDWMMKPDKASYCSNTAIGKMFHVVEGLETAVLHLNLSDGRIDRDAIFLLDTPPTEEELASAEKIYTAYCTELSNIMVAYGILDEGDIAAGCLNTIKQSLAKEHERNYDMREHCLSMYRSLQKKYRKQFFETLGVSQEAWKHEEERALRQAAAWYWVTYKPNPDRHQGLILLSFPWCVASILIKIPELMNRNTSPSVRGHLKAELKSWYDRKARSADDRRNKALHVQSLLSRIDRNMVMDISRHTYGILPGLTLIFFVDKMPYAFASDITDETMQRLGSQDQRQLGQMIDDFKKSSGYRAVSEIEVDAASSNMKVILTSDGKYLDKVNRIKAYCHKYDFLGHAMFIVLNWAERNGITNGEDADLALSFIEFMLQTSQILPIMDNFPSGDHGIVIGKYPHNDTPKLFLKFLKWVIRNSFLHEDSILDMDLLSDAFDILSTEKCLIAAMREYHFVSYSLKFESTESFTQLSIIRKKEKKMCFNIARATSFCATYFNDPARITALFGKSSGIEIKIRETDLGGVPSLVLEIWGNNPQKMNEIADALEIDENKFQLFGNYLYVSDTEYNQLNFVASENLEKRMDKYMHRQRYEGRNRDKADLIHKILPLYYSDNMKELVNNEIMRKLRLMRDGLYNQVSHGNLEMNTTFGKLEVKRFETGMLEKERMSLNKENKAAILKKLKGITKSHNNKDTDVSYVFEILYEGIYYNLTFDKDYKPISLSLQDIVWTDMMILNDRGMDLNLLMTSTHQLKGPSLNHLPLTYHLKHGTVWIERVDKQKGIQMATKQDIPCFIISIQVVTETKYNFTKDPALKDFLFRERNIDVYRSFDKDYIKFQKSFTEMKLTTKMGTLNHPELIRRYQQVALDLAEVRKNYPSSGGNPGKRKPDAIPKLPRRPLPSSRGNHSPRIGLWTQDHAPTAAPPATPSAAPSVDTTNGSRSLLSNNLIQQQSNLGGVCDSEVSQPTSYTVSYNSNIPPSTSNSVARLARSCHARSMHDSPEEDNILDEIVFSVGEVENAINNIPGFHEPGSPSSTPVLTTLRSPVTAENVGLVQTHEDFNRALRPQHGEMAHDDIRASAQDVSTLHVATDSSSPMMYPALNIPNLETGTDPYQEPQIHDPPSPFSEIEMEPPNEEREKWPSPVLVDNDAEASDCSETDSCPDKDKTPSSGSDIEIVHTYEPLIETRQTDEIGC